MTLTISERTIRCGEALRSYSDDDCHTNLIDWLADVMHWCHVGGHNFEFLMAICRCSVDLVFVGD